METIPGQAPPYKGTMDVVMKTVRNEGPFALYKGMMGPLIGVTPMFAICFMGYEVGKHIFTRPEMYQRMQGSDVALIGLAGAVSGLFTTPIMTPLERVKCLMQIQGGEGWKPAEGQRKYDGIMDCLKDTHRQGGFRNSFRGFYATMLRDCTASFFYFSTYEFLKFHRNPKDGSPPGVVSTIFAGGFAGIMNWAGCLPIDTLKSRYQVAPPGKYKHGIRSVFADVMKNEGNVLVSLFSKAFLKSSIQRTKGFMERSYPDFLESFSSQRCLLFGNGINKASLLNVGLLINNKLIMIVV